MVKNILLNILYAGQLDIEKSDVRKQLMINSISSLIGVTFLTFFGLRELLLGGDSFVVAVVLLGAVTSVANHLYLRLTGDYRVTSWYTVLICTVLTLFLLSTGGQQGTGLLWLYGLPNLIFLTLELHRGRIVLGGVLCYTFCILFIPDNPLLLVEYPFSFSLRFFLSLVAVSILAYLYEYTREDGRRELIALNEEFDVLARRDPLTGISNRRDMLEKLEHEEDRFARNGHVFSVLLIDIDNFKKLNDSCGHNAGDHVLVELSRALRQVLQRRDTVARWGGEEFLVLLPETGLEDAVKIAERLRSTVEATRYVYKRKVLQITISVGVSQYHQGEHIETALLSKADKMLYVAKNSGRNRVVV